MNGDARKTVLILGAGTMQLPAIRIAREEGFRVAVADGNPAAPHASMADRFEAVDLKDLGGMLRFAEALRGDGGLDGVFTAGTDFSATVAYVAERLGLPGIPYERALDASDKARMRARFAAAGVPSPAFEEAASVDAGLGVARRIGFPLVVKPVDSMGARGCRLVAGPRELEAFLPEALGHSRRGAVIIEEYMDGPEFSIDAIVHRGRIAYCGVADRHIKFPPYFIEMGHTMPSSAPAADIALVKEAFEAGVRALGIELGAAKGDIKLVASGGARRGMVGEIAARLSGGYMSGWTYPLSSGVEPTRAALRIACGLEPGDLEPRRSDTCAERAYISMPGKVARVLGPTADAMAKVSAHFPRVAPGDDACFPRNNVEKCGNFIAASPSPEAAVAAAEEAAASVIVALRPCHDESEDFIAGCGMETDEFPPDCYPLLAKRLDVERMPDLERRGKGRRVTVGPLDFGPEERDWQGRTPERSARLLSELAGVEFSNDGDVVLRGRFWRAFARASAQGGLYALETFMKEEGWL